MDKWDVARIERERCEGLMSAAITRQAAIDANRAKAAKALNRWDQVENGWDPANSVEITTVADVDRIQAEIALELDKLDIVLIHRVGDLITWNPDTMARSDGNAANVRLILVPCAMWLSREYGHICLVPANTIAD